MNKKVLIALVIIYALIVVSILVAFVIYQTSLSKNTTEVVSYPVSSVVSYTQDPVSIPVVKLTNYFKRSDGKYEFYYSENLKIIREKEGTQILQSLKHLNENNFDPFIAIYSMPSFGTSLEDYADRGKEAKELKHFTVNGLNAISYKYIKDIYEDDEYLIEKDSEFIGVRFRKWSKVNGTYQDLSELLPEVEELVKSIKIN
jgi:hypothetical protein